MESLTAIEMEFWERNDELPVGKLGFSGNKLELLSGFIGGVSGIVTGHPLDTVRIRQQTSPSRDGTFTRLYKVVKHEGARSLYRGMMAPLAASGFQNALLFATFAPAQRYLASENSYFHKSSHLTHSFLAGCIAGAAQTIVTSPAELVKVRMQAPNSKYTSSAQCMISSVRENGLRAGLFKGFGVTFLRDCPNIGIYFLSYEWCKHMLHPSSGKLFLGNSQLGDNVAILLAGGTAGILSWALSYPIDVIKTRLQADTQGLYRGIWHAATHSVRAHGPRILFQGFAACMYRAFVVNSVTFVAFEESRRRLSLPNASTT